MINAFCRLSRKAAVIFCKPAVARKHEKFGLGRVAHTGVLCKNGYTHREPKEPCPDFPSRKGTTWFIGPRPHSKRLIHPFCWAHGRNQQSHMQTDLAATSVAIGRILMLRTRCGPVGKHGEKWSAAVQWRSCVTTLLKLFCVELG